MHNRTKDSGCTQAHHVVKNALSFHNLISAIVRKHDVHVLQTDTVNLMYTYGLPCCMTQPLAQEDNLQHASWAQTGAAACLHCYAEPGVNIFILPVDRNTLKPLIVRLVCLSIENDLHVLLHHVEGNLLASAPWPGSQALQSSKKHLMLWQQATECTVSFLALHYTLSIGTLLIRSARRRKHCSRSQFQDSSFTYGIAMGGSLHSIVKSLQVTTAHYQPPIPRTKLRTLLATAVMQ